MYGMQLLDVFHLRMNMIGEPNYMLEEKCIILKWTNDAIIFPADCSTDDTVFGGMVVLMRCSY